MPSHPLRVVPAFRTAPCSCHSLPLFNTTHSNSICAANVVLSASLQRVPGPWSGMEMPTGGAQYPHVIRQLLAQEVVQPVKVAASSSTAIQYKEGQCSFHGRRTGGASIVSNTDAYRAITVEMSCRSMNWILPRRELHSKIKPPLMVRRNQAALAQLFGLLFSPCMRLFMTMTIFSNEASCFRMQPTRVR
jgi:hypothetical protein